MMSLLPTRIHAVSITACTIVSVLWLPIHSQLGSPADAAESALPNDPETGELPYCPLPEHPRPDFQRRDWLNLNGWWQLRFDGDDLGTSQQWHQKVDTFDKRILVPFPWGSPLSEVGDEAHIAWYARTIRVPTAWKGKRVFLVVGACDWHTTGWLDSVQVGSHRGGYTPFELELTDQVQFGKDQTVALRVDDAPRPFKLEGKQGYGPARGIWQTVYLEARPAAHLKTLHFTPDIDAQKVTVQGELRDADSQPLSLRLRLMTGNVEQPLVRTDVPANVTKWQTEMAIPDPRLWSLHDPFLYEVVAELENEDGDVDRVNSYFGMRKISVETLPGTEYSYVALNNQPVYLQMTLDQAYHPEGFYTFPSDGFMRDEILRSRRIGLNGMRIHVKTGIPRKLYWADRLGMLIMADVPNSWGEPTEEMKRETVTALTGMIRRDYNHPSVFSWVIFNETWGLSTKDKGYTPETQRWVASMYDLAKSLDPTRLVEDNSANRRDHVATDINSWHAYLPGYGWQKELSRNAKNTFPGSTWNFARGKKQDRQPQFNSECGNVWGYEGSTGDVDWSWDYHLMINQFRRHPVTCGWLYTEHHDVVNEWNGYYRYDRSAKFTGLSDLVDGMSLSDLHAPVYLSPGVDLCQAVKTGETVSVPLWASVMCDFGKPEQFAVLQTTLYGWDTLGRKRMWKQSHQALTLKPWMNEEVVSLDVSMPATPGLAVLAMVLEDATGRVLHRNFTTFLVEDRDEEDRRPASGKSNPRRIRIDPKEFSSAQWSQKQWDVLDGLKVNGAGSGYFEYRVPWPDGLDPKQVVDATFVMEASAKQLFGKDREGAKQMRGDYMRGRGTHDPSRNPNSYPMTDTILYPSAVRVRVCGVSAGIHDLPDDPADHRGILSWYSQRKDRRLREAGSYGYLIRARVPTDAIQKAANAKELVIRLEVDDALPGGLAIYGKRFGRFPLDPTLVVRVSQ